MTLSLLYGDNILHRAVINRVTETFEDGHTDTTGDPGTAAQNDLDAAGSGRRLVAESCRLGHRSETYLRSSVPTDTRDPSRYPQSTFLRGSCLRCENFGLAQLSSMPCSHQGPSLLTLAGFASAFRLSRTS